MIFTSMKVSLHRLRRIIQEEVERLYELDTSGTAEKPGAETAKETTGTIDVNKISKAANIDPQLLKTAILNLKSGKRTTKDNQVFGDLFAKLMQASPENTQTVMNVLKKVELKPKKNAGV